MKGQETLTIAGRVLPAGPVYLAAGLPVALLLHLLSCGLLKLGTEMLFHESGHALTAWFFGHPGIPTAKGFAVHWEQKTPLVLLVWGAMLWLAWRCRESKRLAGLVGALALVYPLLAFTRSHEHLISLGGHASELTFAAIFAWGALRGGMQAEGERPLYGAMAWFLWTSYLLLCWRLTFDPLQRVVYESISITGGDNDYTKVSDALGWKLQSLTGLMLVIGLIVPPALIGTWWTLFRDDAGRARLRALLGLPSAR